MIWIILQQAQHAQNLNLQIIRHATPVLGARLPPSVTSTAMSHGTYRQRHCLVWLRAPCKLLLCQHAEWRYIVLLQAVPV